MGVVIDEVVGEVESTTQTEASDMDENDELVASTGIRDYELLVQLSHLKERQLRVKAD